MGLFRRRSPAEGRPEEQGGDNPLLALVGMTVAEATFADGRLAVTRRGPDGEARLEAFGYAAITLHGTQAVPGTSPFAELLGGLPGKKVHGVRMRAGAGMRIELGDDLEVATEMGEGDYAGDIAVSLTGPGNGRVDFNKDGFVRRSQ